MVPIFEDQGLSCTSMPKPVLLFLGGVCPGQPLLGFLCCLFCLLLDKVPYCVGGLLYPTLMPLRNGNFLEIPSSTPIAFVAFHYTVEDWECDSAVERIREAMGSIPSHA